MSEATDILLPPDERDDVYPWLQDFADGSRKNFGYPMRNAVAFGEQWTIVTNGYVLIFVPNGHANAEISAAAQDSLNLLLQSWPSGEAHELSLAELKAACGAESEVCAHCHGKPTACNECVGGMVEHECSCGDVHDAPCERCGGKMEVECRECSPYNSGFTAERVQLFDGAEFSINLVRAAIRHFPNAPATYVASASATRLAPAAIIGDRWRVLIMPLRPGDSYRADGTRRCAVQFPAVRNG